MNASGLSPTGGSITVDDAGNRILFTGSSSQYAALHILLQRLDSPTREVLVEVTVAEVTLTDETRAGLDFFFSANHAGSTISGGTATFPAPTTGGIAGGGLSLGTTGASLNFLNAAGDLRAEFNAFAENNKVNVLSRPHLTATSGSSAQIEVGDQVPIITSQAASGQTTGGTTDTLQTVQYRQTGVTLNITPIIYGDDRVDITIDQEVADVRDNPNTAIGSPIIGSRSVTTTLTLADGRSAVLGGLMQDSYSKDNKGIPFLKDIPLLGQAFRNDDINGAKTELVVLITPFIIRDADDMSNLANQMTNDINKAFETGRGASYTLTPFALGRGFGIGAPDPNVTGASLQRPAAATPASAAQRPAADAPAWSTRRSPPPPRPGRRRGQVSRRPADAFKAEGGDDVVARRIVDNDRDAIEGGRIVAVAARKSGRQLGIADRFAGPVQDHVGRHGNIARRDVGRVDVAHQGDGVMLDIGAVGDGVIAALTVDQLVLDGEDADHDGRCDGQGGQGLDQGEAAHARVGIEAAAHHTKPLARKAAVARARAAP